MAAFKDAFEEFFTNYPKDGPLVRKDMMADNVELHSCGNTLQVPWAGTWHGIAGIETFMALVWEHLKITRFDIVSSVYDELGALYLSEMDIEHPKTGAVMTLPKADSVTVVDGRIRMYREVYDVAAVATFLKP